MIVKRFESQEDWYIFRRGKITGSSLKGITEKKGGGKKIGFYELLAERLTGIPTQEEEGEKPMARGTRLESEALSRFIVETGKDVDTSLLIWTRDDNENIAVSPDGVIGETEAAEAKCLSSARHLEAYLTQEIPTDYIEQTRQYFVCNEKLETLYVVFYDPRVTCKDYFVIEVKREDVQMEVIKFLQHERQTLMEIEELVAKLTAK